MFFFFFFFFFFSLPLSLSLTHTHTHTLSHLAMLQVVYVAPMKALAAEMVRNFGARLSALGIVVKELTGDMQLSKAEIIKTQVSYSTEFAFTSYVY